ncbi:DJ-1/PfpI family protein [Shewanella sp. C32]|uniref:DJ-1/PfpI family protein n=1 Tax=Shewanella electrica TaxID=515560 RepID=A0ABT2FL99_9GAMM|nr:DJ-1/PfpI family protein [Shewanella electrica]MCH1925583.1 DJ-1/PfpI family protein [Shewanella electrica]MCS4557110.1 DJ-1/PfpI family protein [Shewanella electrica]
MNRRQFTLSCLATAAASSSVLLPSVASANAPVASLPVASVHSRFAEVPRSTNKPHIAFLVYDGMTLLDLVGPMEILSNNNFDVDFVAASLAPVYAESNSNKRLGVLPTATFADVSHTDILFAPGSTNPLQAVKQPELLAWVAQVGAKATWVTSVCSGAIILGAAGLLKGYQATSHWGWLDKLRYFGAVPTQQRVVHDGNRVTGAGVTSGIDFGLVLLSLLLGEDVARARQLGLEYDPKPPFTGGSVDTAPVALVERSRDAYQAFLDKVEPQRMQLLQQFAQRLNVQLP